jgi:hypothetical protein
MLGRFIAAFHLEEGTIQESHEEVFRGLVGRSLHVVPPYPLLYARTTNNRGHYTIWGPAVLPTVLLSRVEFVVPVDPQEETAVRPTGGR